jgi:hypothetical protein
MSRLFYGRSLWVIVQPNRIEKISDKSDGRRIMYDHAVLLYRSGDSAK